MELTAYLAKLEPWSLLNPLANGVEGTWGQVSKCNGVELTIQLHQSLAVFST